MTLDATQILGGLYQGSRPPVGVDVRQAGFDSLVLSAQDYQPASDLFPGVSVYHVPFWDDYHHAMSPETLERVRASARFVVTSLRRGENVLVTCWMGLNRSGLIAGLALKALTGLPGSHVLALIQGQRSGSLQNPRFCDLLVQ
jgi:protein-tyrosine phosphatase